MRGGDLLHAMLIKLNLRAINTEAYCVEQTKTYISSCRNSMIDYILLEEDLVPSVRHVEIAAETPDNTAFHLPVILHIELNRINETLLPCSKQRIAWSKCTANDIETCIENVANYLAPGCSPQTLFETSGEIDAQVSFLCEAICQAWQTLPRVVYNKKTKPF